MDVIERGLSSVEKLRSTQASLLPHISNITPSSSIYAADWVQYIYTIRKFRYFWKKMLGIMLQFLYLTIVSTYLKWHDARARNDFIEFLAISLMLCVRVLSQELEKFCRKHFRTKMFRASNTCRCRRRLTEDEFAENLLQLTLHGPYRERFSIYEYRRGQHRASKPHTSIYGT